MSEIKLFKQRTGILSTALLYFAISIFPACGSSGFYFAPIDGFSEKTNKVIREFLIKTGDYRGRKVAVFDGDGTVMGQCPHYLADECLYGEAIKHPEKKPEVISKMKKWSNVSIRYVINRVYFFEGDTIKNVRSRGDYYFKKYYKNKIFKQMRELISLLTRNGFEVWIVTASPEAMYQQFLGRELQIPITNIIGVKAIIRKGKITRSIVEPVPQDHGKRQSIETFVQEQPLFIAGNSRGDKEMIEYSRGIRMIINPDEHIAHDQKESIAEYARKNNWLIERIKDIPEAGFPAVSSGEYGVRRNKPRDKE